MVRSLGWGGTERQTVELAKNFDRSVFLPHVGCFDANGVRLQELLGNNIPVLQLPVRSFLHSSALSAARRLARYIEAHRIPLVHTFDFPVTIFAAPLCRWLRTPVVLSSHRGYRSKYALKYRLLLRISDHLVDGIVANCEAMHRDLVDGYRIPDRLVHVCYNGVDLGRFHPPLSARPQDRNRVPVVGFVGVLRPEKGLHLLLEAFAEARRRFPKLRLMIVDSGPEQESLQQHSIHLFGDSGACQFHPATVDVTPWLHSIDLFVLPSFHEAFSNSLLEAMACGCCALASRVGGNPELVRHGQTGLLFEPANAADLAGKLIHLVEHPDERGRLAQAGLDWVRKDFSIEASAARMQHIYQSLLSERGCRLQPSGPAG